MKKELSKTKYYVLLFLVMFLFYGVFMCGYYIFNSEVRGMRITNIAAIQSNYAKYMIDMNDEFIDYMIEFEELLKTPQREYSKEELDVIAKNLENQNNIVKRLQENPPNTNNKDYLEVYKDYLKMYAFYIQGEVMRVEYVSAYKKEYTPEEEANNLTANDETYIMGIELCNMMGAMVLENHVIVNKIRDTKIDSKHDIIPLEEWQQQVAEKEQEYKENNKTSVDLTVPNKEPAPSVTVNPEDTEKTGS